MRDEAPEEERGAKRKAEGDELEQERLRENAAASSESMAIEAVSGGGEDQEEQGHGVEETRSAKEDTKFGAVAARLNYIAADMPDIQFSCKEACREMSAPTAQSWASIKRIGRYLVGRPRVSWNFPWKDEVGDWRAYTDSDWAGNLKTRKSTSGGLIMLGPHCLKTWSTTQGAPALSSCEAEYYAVVEGATRALGVQTAAKELGIEAGDLVIEVSTDSSGAKSFASRRGSGRVRHIETKWLWLQHAVAVGRFQMRMVAGATNPADVCTKYLTLSEAKAKLEAVNVEVEEKESRAAKAACVRPRLKWADAEDSEEEAVGGACAFCGLWADECWSSRLRGGCRESSSYAGHPVVDESCAAIRLKDRGGSEKRASPISQ